MTDELPQHDMLPAVDFCRKCLRSAKEIHEHGYACWTEEYATWIAHQAINIMRRVKDAE